MSDPTSSSDASVGEAFTPAAERVLARAGRIAAEQGAGSVEPEHLLAALVADESRASALLAEQGFDVAAVRSLLATRPAGAGPTRPVAPTEGGDVRLVRLEARRFARLAGSQDGVGSEHLLFGLAVVPSSVAEALSECGLDEAAATRLSKAERVPAGDPLEVDCDLVFAGEPGAESARPPAFEPHRADETVRGETLRDEPAAIPEVEAVAVHRIVDAAANRAREGLRVAEDHVRFVLDDGHLVSLLKALRHDLAAATRVFDAVALLRSRDTAGDVGTSIETAAEIRRSSAEHVLRAALARSEEAIRTLEEFGKLLAPGAGTRFERLRYRLYAIEQAALVTVAARRSLADRELYLLVTRDLCRRPPEEVVCEALRGGVSIVQLREKALPDRELLDWARQVRRWTREAGALLVVNDRADLAVLCDADGVHVGQEELDVRSARRIVGPRRLVGVSTHDLEQARQAVLDGADYLGVGPTFPSRTKSFDAFAGLDVVRSVAAEISLPWYAIGGIDESNVSEVVAAGGRRIAVTGAICGAEEPAAAAASLCAALANDARSTRRTL